MRHNLTREELHFLLSLGWAASREGLSQNTILPFSAIAVLLLLEFQERQFQLHVLLESLKEIFNN